MDGFVILRCGTIAGIDFPFPIGIIVYGTRNEARRARDGYGRWQIRYISETIH